LEDYGMRFIPTPQDFLEEVPMKEWMNNGKGEPPPSFKKLDPSSRLGKKKKIYTFDQIEEKFPDKFKEIEKEKEKEEVEVEEEVKEETQTPPRGPQKPYYMD
jgi:hypothetical protein